MRERELGDMQAEVLKEADVALSSRSSVKGIIRKSLAGLIMLSLQAISQDVLLFVED